MTAVAVDVGTRVAGMPIPGTGTVGVEVARELTVDVRTGVDVMRKVGVEVGAPGGVAVPYATPVGVELALGIAVAGVPVAVGVPLAGGATLFDGEASSHTRAPPSRIITISPAPPSANNNVLLGDGATL